MRTPLAIVFTLAAIFLTGCSGPLGTASAVGAPPTTPDWPADALAYSQKAAEYQNDIIIALPVFWVGNGSTYTDLPLDPEEARQAADQIQEIRSSVGDLEPPPVLLPYHRALILAALECSRSVNTAARLTEDDPNSAATMLAIITLRNQCINALNQAQLEGARYAATVGGYPPNE